MPCFFSRSALDSDAATAPSMRPLIVASASMKRLTVEPEPTPITPSWAYLRAAGATWRLSSSVFISPQLFLLLRRHIGADAFVQLGRHADRFAGRRMRM